MKAPVYVGETASKHRAGQVLAPPGRVGSWMGRVHGSGGNQGSFPEGWLPEGPDSR